MKATWNGEVLAESDKTLLLEGNHYFPPSSIKKEYFRSSDLNTTCPWKGVASYYHIEVDGKLNKDAAWVYNIPSVAASKIKEHIAFWKGVEIS